MSDMALDRPEVVGERERDLDVGTDQAAEQQPGVRDDAVQIEHLRLEFLAAAERHELAGERRGPVARLEHLLEIVALRGRLGLAQGELRRPADRRQQVAEVVDDAADEASEGFLFLRVIELCLEGLAIGEIQHDAFVRPDHARRVTDGARADHGGDEPAVSALEQRLRVRKLGTVRPQRFAHGAAHAGIGEKLGDVQPLQQLGRVVPEHRHERRVDGEDDARRRGLEQADRHAFEQPAKFFFRLAERVLGEPAAGDVLDHHQCCGRAAVAILHGRHRHSSPDDRAVTAAEPLFDLIIVDCTGHQLIEMRAFGRGIVLVREVAE